MTWRIGKGIAAVVLAVAGVTACSPASPDPIRIGVSPFPTYELLFLAEERGFFRDEGVAVKLVELGSIGDVQRAVRLDQVDAALLTGVDALEIGSRVHDAAGPFQIVWALSYSNGADAILARPPISTLADLRGKRIGLEDVALEKVWG